MKRATTCGLLSYRLGRGGFGCWLVLRILDGWLCRRLVGLRGWLVRLLVLVPVEHLEHEERSKLFQGAFLSREIETSSMVSSAKKKAAIWNYRQTRARVFDAGNLIQVQRYKTLLDMMSDVMMTI